MFDDVQQVQDLLATGIADCTILVVGDVMLDRYYFGEVSRISPEAPVPVNRIQTELETLGGAGNVAANLALLGAKVILAGITGEDENAKRVHALLEKHGISADGLLATKRRTTTKLRIMGGHQQMMRLDFEDTMPVRGKIETDLKQKVAEYLQRGVDGVIISDYGKGVCTKSLCRSIISQNSLLDIPVIVDPKGADWHKYAGAPFITPNLKELGEAVKRKVKNEDAIVKRFAEAICKRFNIGGMVVTRSDKGLSLIHDGLTLHVPTYAQEVFDVSGAGDTVIAVLAAALSKGLPAADAARLANLAAGIVVGKIGTHAIRREELQTAVEHFRPEGLRHKD